MIVVTDSIKSLIQQFFFVISISMMLFLFVSNLRDIVTLMGGSVNEPD